MFTPLHNIKIIKFTPLLNIKKVEFSPLINIKWIAFTPSLIIKRITFVLQVQDDEVGDKGSVEVTYQVTQCTNIGAMCIKGIWVWYVDESGEESHIHIRNDFSATINSEDYDDLNIVPYHNMYIYVKQVTSLFVIIRGFGFKVLYAKTGRIYMTFDPYYANKVRNCYGFFLCVSLLCKRLWITVIFWSS